MESYDHENAKFFEVKSFFFNVKVRDNPALKNVYKMIPITWM